MVLSHCLEVGLGLVLLISLSAKLANHQGKVINKIHRDKDKIRFLCFNAICRFITLICRSRYLILLSLSLKLYE